MGLFNLFKKKESVMDKMQRMKVNSSGEDLTKLDEKGNLPFGWISHNMVFTKKINDEYSYFMNTWIESRNQEPMKQYEALKSFIIYIKDARKLCLSKGECFDKWFNDCIADEEYLKKRENELNEIIEEIKGKA